MECYLLFLAAWIYSVIFTKKVKIDNNNVIFKKMEKLSNKFKIPIESLLDNDFLMKREFIDYLPLINIFSVLIKKDTLFWKYEVAKKKIYESIPVLEYQDKLETDNKERIYLEEKVYHIGYFIDGRPKNYFFKFNGEEIIILDSSASIFKELSPEESVNFLLYLLYVWYNGGYRYLNGSESLGEIFNDNLTEILLTKFECNNNVGEIKLTRKCK